MAVYYCTEDENASFMSLSETGALEETGVFPQNICNNLDSFLEAVREHYDMLNELANYFKYLRQAAQDDSSLELMASFQEYIYDCMCTMKKTLRAKQRDPVNTVPSGNLSELFVQYQNGSRCERQNTQYISVLDGNRIATYLETMYNRLSTK
ncbi:uncharacterized protein LOC123562145 [Mercenaria mercenaria]|uniref:uncharacterized protein LOC123562145 n=1 Tax=Mercenaria mercenaria TaxID=6596 RepID=UPI001E1D88AE|nr:uncharacterized protein LOC123562145 [Mercenaria mercenaria]